MLPVKIIIQLLVIIHLIISFQACTDRDNIGGNAPLTMQSTGGEQAGESGIVIESTGGDMAGSEGGTNSIAGEQAGDIIDLCATQVCGPGFVCQASTGNCVDPCEDVECPASQLCENGSCIDLCEDVVCEDGLGCQNGVCLDLCAIVLCDDHTRCDTSSGQCVSLCEDVICPFGQRCEDTTGECIASCQDVICEDGLVCDQQSGECIDLCADIECDEGLICDRNSSACVNICDQVTCAEGWTCDDTGSCIYDDPCLTVECGSNDLCNPDTLQCELYLCQPDIYEMGITNNTADRATLLQSRTQRIDQLSICLLDTDWYTLIIPARHSLTMTLYFQHDVGDLMFRVHDSDNLIIPIHEINTQTDHETLHIPMSNEDQEIYLRVSTANSIIDQNRYTLTLEFDDSANQCNTESDCPSPAECINGQCVTPYMPMCTQDSECAVYQQCIDDMCIDTIMPQCEDDMFEPNNNSQQATSLVNRTMWRAQICNADPDYYQLEIDRLSRVEINVSFDHAMGDIDAVLKLNGQVVASSTSVNDHESLIVDTAMPGNYELMIYGASEQVENLYQVNMIVTASDQAPVEHCEDTEDCMNTQVCVSRVCIDQCEDRYEPNNSLMDSTVLNLMPNMSLTLAGLTICMGDIDYYQVDSVVGDQLQVDLTFNHEVLDLDLAIVDSDYNVITNSTGIGGTESITYEFPDTGSYWIFVYAFLNDEESNLYDLDVQLSREN